jgi:hypothetical protein
VELFKVVVASGGETFIVDGLRHDGKLWIVPGWIRDAELRAPARIVRFDDHEHQKSENYPGFDYAVREPIPTAVLDGGDREHSGYEVVEAPLIAFANSEYPYQRRPLIKSA